MSDLAHDNTVSRPSREDAHSAHEWFSLAWRPAGSRSLTEGWVRAGQTEGKSNAPRTRPVPPPRPTLASFRR